MSASKMNLTLLVDAERNKVVFAEAGKDFVDFLLNLLALPVGTVIRLLTKETMVGCIANLYDSLEKLNESYLQSNQNKDFLLKPTLPTQVTDPNFLLAGNNKKPEDQMLYFRQDHPGYVSDIHNSVCSNSRSQGYGARYMNQEVKLAGTNCSTSTDRSTSDQGGYVKGLVTYMVTDDLSVSPLSMVSAVGLLNKLNIKDFGVLEQKFVKFGFDEALDLLKASLSSKEALTAAFLLKQKVRDGADGRRCRMSFYMTYQLDIVDFNIDEVRSRLSCLSYSFTECEAFGIVDFVPLKTLTIREIEFCSI
ncbi:unnamed protein product [Dovyalis caffra]|uniref:DUF674 family protein n=1 Tax=Dovyalis caffra TaxID=77055 RepID=A0AAV1QUZ5_9ROSI|nr:unnamed protein product [Dovyalis caffra]